MRRLNRLPVEEQTKSAAEMRLQRHIHAEAGLD